MSLSGRKRSPLWDLFTFNEEKNRTLCKACTSFHRKGKNSTPLVQHLKQCHTELHKQLEEQKATALSTKESAARVSGSSTSRAKQVKLEEVVILEPKNPRRFQPDNPVQRDIARKQALFFMACNIAPGTTEDSMFKSFLTALNPMYTPPRRAALCSGQDRVFCELKDKISALLSTPQRMSLVMDIWSKRGLGQSLLGVKVAFFDLEAKERRILTVAVQPMQQPHTAENILAATQTVLDRFNVPMEKVGTEYLNY